MTENLELEAPPLHPAHRRQLTVLSVLMHAGLVVIGLCAVYSLQPTMGPRHWAAYVLVALVMLICTAATRGGCGFTDAGRLLTALGAGLVLKLAREPQLANLSGLGEHLPSWLTGANLTIGSLGLLVAVVCGFWFLRTLNGYLGHGHKPPFLWALNGSVLLVLALSLVTFFTLRRFYELDTMYLALLVGNAVQYYLLLRLTLSASGRMRVGAGPQVYLAIAILLACGRNLLGGMMMGGGARHERNEADGATGGPRLAVRAHAAAGVRHAGATGPRGGPQARSVHRLRGCGGGGRGGAVRAVGVVPAGARRGTGGPTREANGGSQWPPLPAWAWLGIAVLSAFGAQSVKAAGLEIIQLVLYFGLAYMLLVNVLTAAEQRRQAVRVLLAATTLVIAYAVVQYATATDPQAVMSVFQSRTAYSGFLVVVLPLFFGLTLWSELTWERCWTGLVIVAGGLTILAPPLVWVLAVVLVVMAAGWGRAKMAATVALAAAAFPLTLTLAPLNRQVFREMLNPYEEGPVYKVMEVGGEGAAETPAGPIIKKRWIEWMPSLNMLGEHFMLGVGAGNYQLNIGQPEYYGFLPNVKKSEPDTNNLYLVTGGSMGLAGLVCLVAFLGYFWQLAGRLWMHAQTPGARALACGLYGACLALLIANLFTSVLVRGTALAWVLVCALVAGMAHETSSA